MTDYEIIQGLMQNDNSAYSHLYKEYYPVTERLILKNSGTEDEAKDIFQ